MISLRRRSTSASGVPRRPGARLGAEFSDTPTGLNDTSVAGILDGRRMAASLTTTVFDTVSRVYDTPLLQRVVYRPSQDVVIEELRRRGPRRIADVGCGTGVLSARILAELDVESVYGFDLSDGMLAQARAKTDGVRWVRAGAEQLPLENGSLDAVVTTEAFQFFDRPRALREFHRVLAGGGCLIIASVNTPVAALGRVIPGGPAFATASEIRSLVQHAGFQIDLQRRVGRALTSTLFPTFATIATRPA
jgi:ubiquinone/menaquinone biosynthesis C-methylase UbiE